MYIITSFALIGPNILSFCLLTHDTIDTSTHTDTQWRNSQVPLIIGQSKVINFDNPFWYILYMCIPILLSGLIGPPIFKFRGRNITNNFFWFSLNLFKVMKFKGYLLSRTSELMSYIMGKSRNLLRQDQKKSKWATWPEKNGTRLYLLDDFFLTWD
jgi:hypothetical protein